MGFEKPSGVVANGEAELPGGFTTLASLEDQLQK